MRLGGERLFSRDLDVRHIQAEGQSVAMPARARAIVGLRQPGPNTALFGAALRSTRFISDQSRRKPFRAA